MFCSHERLFKRALNEDRAVKRVNTVIEITSCFFFFLETLFFDQLQQSTIFTATRSYHVHACFRLRLAFVNTHVNENLSVNGHATIICFGYRGYVSLSIFKRNTVQVNWLLSIAKEFVFW